MIPDVMGPAEAAAALGVSRQRMHQLEQKPEFPEALELSVGRVWDGPTMRAYAADRSSRQLKHQRCLLEYRRCGTVSGAARYADIAPATARKYLRDVGLHV